MSNTKQTPAEVTDSRRFPWWKMAISLLLLVHLGGVIAPPFYTATRTPIGAESPVAAESFVRFEPYINMMFLDHGYAFFAPDPGPSHLVRFRVEFDDGRPPVEHMFPDLERHWPRLLYHRHFMLAEQLHADYVTPIAPARPTREAGESAASWQQRLEDWEYDHARWKQGRDRYMAKWKSFENHLLKRYGGSRVSLIRVEHQLAPPDPSLVPFDLRNEDNEGDYARYIDLNEYPPAEMPEAASVPLRPQPVPPIAPPLEALP